MFEKPMLCGVNGSKNNSFEPILKEIKKKTLLELENRHEKLFKEFYKGKISKDIFRVKVDEINSEISEIKREWL